MRFVVVGVCLMLFLPSGACAQTEEGAELTAAPFSAPILQAVPSTAIESELRLYLENGSDVLEFYPRMVTPRVCRQRDFPIPQESNHARAGLMLRIEDGECVTGHPYFVHNPDTHRIWPIQEVEVLAIFQAMKEIYIPSAPE